MAPVPRSRASEVLRRLSEGDDSDDDFESEPASTRPPLLQRMSSIGGIRTAAVIAVAVLVGLGLVVARRPAPIEGRLPLVSVVPEADGTAAPDAATGAGARSGGDPAVGVGTAPEPPGSGPESDDGEPVAAASGEVVVHVVGAVVAPGVVRLPVGSRAVDAVQAAGGLRSDADPARVNLAALVVDGYRVLVPAVGQEFVPDTVADPAPPASAAPGTGSSSGGSSPGAGRTELVDINTATAEQFETLPGVGPATAAAIVAHRERDGPFASVDALIEVRGIGEAKLEALRDLVTVSRR